MFGMGTGGSSPLSSPDFSSVLLESTIILLGLPKLTENYIERLILGFLFFSPSQFPAKAFCLNVRLGKQRFDLFRSSPRPISIGLLNTLLRFHSRPIYLVVSQGPYQSILWEVSS